MSHPKMEDSAPVGSNFIKNIIEEDLKTDKYDGRVFTRFPPEPNGYLHIGHGKTICLNFGLAKTFEKAQCHLRFDDTNPEKEYDKYIEAIKKDVKWLGYDWGEHLYFASDYFDKLYELAQGLIRKGKAYVCELNSEEMRKYRGSLTEPGKNSPYRDRPVEESLRLFQEMREGKHEEGKYTLRVKIDMASPNISMRDPAIYRIKKISHPRTGDSWPIYPLYDFTHCISDSIEKITHSLCTLEFEDNRPLYNWFLIECELYRPQQIEFAKLKLEYTVLSKRNLKRLVDEERVNGWDDPRMPTISGMRRRGITPTSIRNFCDQIGITKKDSYIAMSTFEAAIRDDLNKVCPRAFAVLRPVKVIIENFPEDEIQEIEAPFHPQDESFGSRKIPFTRELYIERDDFMEDPPKKFFRLGPDRNVRLKYAYVINCHRVVKDPDTDEVVELRCTYFKDTFGGVTPEGMKKVKGIINWVSGKESVEAEVRLFDRLYRVPDPSREEGDFVDYLNPNSLETLPHARVERSLAESKPEDRFQFERQGYFYVDPDSSNEKLVFNRTVTLRDTWAKIEKENNEKKGS